MRLNLHFKCVCAWISLLSLTSFVSWLVWLLIYGLILAPDHATEPGTNCLGMYESMCLQTCVCSFCVPSHNQTFAEYCMKWDDRNDCQGTAIDSRNTTGCIDAFQHRDNIIKSLYVSVFVLIVCFCSFLVVTNDIRERNKDTICENRINNDNDIEVGTELKELSINENIKFND